MLTRKSIAVFGGTFDPIHHGHLRSAVELREVLGADEFRLMPSHQPPLRDRPGASSELRLAMVSRAIAGEPGLAVEARELRRDGPSYSADTLGEIRRECGEEAALVFIVGSDAFNHLHRWRHWQEIFSVAHMLVLQRPDYPLQPVEALREFLAPRWVEEVEALRRRPHGNICRLELAQLAISATDIRQRIAEGRSVRYLLPDDVIQIIDDQRLYQAEDTHH